MSEGNDSAQKGRLCGLCNNDISKYCCPRCGVVYCSLNCYKSEKHLQCSESFYQDCVNQELASQEVDDDAKKKMIDILKKMQNNDLNEDVDSDLGIDVEEIDSDDDSEIDLQSRLKDLNLNDPDAIWGALTNDERNEFEALINGGDIGTILPQWEPWWMYRKETPLVEEVKNDDNSFLDNCPKLINVPQFNTLTSVKPSPAISYNISNTLASYAFILRYFNGEVDPIEGATYILDICANLNSNTNYEEMDIAVEAVAQCCLQSELIETDKDSLDVMKNDVLRLLQGPSEDNKLYYSKAALSHLIQMFTDSKTQMKINSKVKSIHKGEFTKKYPDHEKFLATKLDKSKINKVVKKIEFYLSFLNSCDIECK